MESENATGPLDPVQVIVQPPAATAGIEVAAAKASDFWRGQDRILDCMQVFARGWFDRRHAGTRAALEAAQRICTARTPVEAAHEYQTWVSGSLQRIATDSIALQRELTDIGDALISASSHPYGVPAFVFGRGPST